jgi:hypothetical protein
MRHLSRFELRQRARALYNNPEVPDHINQHNQRQWVRSVMRLGDKWLVRKQIERRDSPYP